MHFQFQERSRKKVRPGDVFSVLLPTDEYVFGRVVAVDATVGPIANLLLIYFYDSRSESTEIPHEDLTTDRFLIPPTLASNTGWTTGYFKTLDNLPIGESDVLKQHCFRRSNGKLYDEFSNELKKPVEPIGIWGAGNVYSIDRYVGHVLGLGETEY